MGPFATAVLIGCLQGLGWLLGLTALLALVAAIAVAARGGDVPDPGSLVVFAVVCSAAAGTCIWTARRLR